MSNAVKIKKAITNLQKKVDKKILTFADAAQELMVNKVQEVIANKVDKTYSVGKLFRSIKKTPLTLSGIKLKAQIISDSRVAKYNIGVVKGFPSGRLPNLTGIRRRLQEHGYYGSLKQATFAVALKIMERGNKPFPFMALGLAKSKRGIGKLAKKEGLTIA